MGNNRLASVSVWRQKEVISALDQHQSSEFYHLPVVADEEQLVTVIAGHHLNDDSD